MGPARTHLTVEQNQIFSSSCDSSCGLFAVEWLSRSKLLYERADMARDTETIGRSPLWQIVIIILSAYVLIALFLSAIMPLSPATRELLNIIDSIICVIFIGDFIYMLAVNGRDYLRWGWIDFVSSIPAIEFLRWGRLFRVFRVMRILRGFRSVRVLFRYLFVTGPRACC